MSENEEKGNEQKAGRVWWLTFLWLVMLVGAFFVPIWWGSLLVVIVSLGPLILSVWTEWAPEDFFFGFNYEGEIRIIVRSGAFWKAFLQWAGWHLATQEDVDEGNALRIWDVIPGDPPKNWFRDLFGGFYFVGIPPFQTVMSYDFKWANLDENGEKKPHNETISWVFAKENVYIIDMIDVEDSNGMALSLEFTMPIRIVNPWEALFAAKSWLAMIGSLLQPAFKDFMGTYHYEELKAMKKKSLLPPEKLALATTEEEKEDSLTPLLWEEIEKKVKREKTETVVQVSEDTLRIFGVLIDKKLSGFRAIDPPPSYRDLTTRRYEAREEAAAEEIRGKGKGRATVNQVIIPVMAIARQLAGFLSEQELSPDEWRKVGEMVDQAYEIFLTQQGLQSVRPADKVIISSGARGLGQEVSGLATREAIREAVRREIGKKIEEEE